MKSKQTKSALLSSVIALVLCFAMLLGSTFAWFTDNASTSVNKIQAGTLKVDIVDENGNSLKDKTLNFKKADNSGSEEILWEPGCTYELEKFYIKNNGNLALEYDVVITGLDGDAKLNEAIEWDVTYALATTALSSSVKVLLPGEKSGEIVVKGHMKETAGNEYQGLSIQGVAVTVYATQTPYEYDSYGNQYDANATFDNVVTASDLYDAIENAEDGATIVLKNDVTLNRILVVDKKITLDLNGCTITTDKNSEEYGWNDGNWSIISVRGGDLTVTGNGTILGVTGVTYAADVCDGGKLTIENGKFYGSLTSVYAYKGTVVINGGIFGVTNPESSAGTRYILNCYDTNYRNGTASFVVNGGAFVGFNPADTKSEGNGENFVSEGKESVNIDGTYYVISENSTTVSNAEELANALKNGGSYVLTNDIDLENVAWETITVDNALVLDGAGHTIKNLKIRNYHHEQNGTQYGFGFIAQANANVTISNLTFDGADVGPTEEHIAAEKGNIGGVVIGYSMNTTVLNNVTVKNSKVSGYGKLGALIGSVQGGTATLTSCTSTDNTIVGGSNMAGLIGCVCGKDNATVTNCTVENITYTHNRTSEELYTLTSDVTVKGEDDYDDFTLKAGQVFNLNKNTYYYNYTADYYTYITGACGQATIDGTTYNFCEEIAVNK